MNKRTRIKFCGITRESDARAAIELGADALGFVFYAPSPRYIAPEAARDIVGRLPPFVSAVGLFVDAPLAEVRAVAASVVLDAVQFHGEEPADYCQAYGGPYLKAIRLETGATLRDAAQAYAGARALLLDSYHPTLIGGTGQAFDWTLIPAQRDKPIVLAGGLDAGNVARAIRAVRPYAVDVSGGIESAKGIKDYDKMQAFVAEVHAVERD
jgi:phosphoribosylanthranilate isomerase